MSEWDSLTFDEAPTCPLDLGRHENPRGDTAGPGDTRTRLDGEHASAGYVRRPRRRDHRNKLVEITVRAFVSEFTLGRLGTDAAVERLDVRHVPGEKGAVVGQRHPVRNLDVCEMYQSVKGHRQVGRICYLGVSARSA